MSAEERERLMQSAELLDALCEQITSDQERSPAPPLLSYGMLSVVCRMACCLVNAQEHSPARALFLPAQAMVINFMLTCLVAVSVGLITGMMSGEIVLVWPSATQC